MTLQSVQPEAATEETLPSRESRGLGRSRIWGTLDPRKVSAPYVTNEIPITNAKLFGTFSDIGQKDVGGFILPVYYMLGIAAVTYFVMEHTAVGRRIYATGFNTEAARLTGIKTKRIQFCSLLVS